ncbi:MAG: MBOAT family protein [Clostridiales bacterium]|nr:MBOAT family protein [Clostridiales bacterium]
MLSISTYYSLQYLLLLSAAVVFYEIFPLRARRWVMLLFSYLFFFAVSGKLVCYLILSTLSIHHIGIWLSDVQAESKAKLALLGKEAKEEKKALSASYLHKQRCIMTFAVILHVGMLLMLKYTPFAVENLNALIHFTGISYTFRLKKILVPIGISFYTLQAVAYLFDVYRQKIEADKNLLRLSLFMGFFPQIMEGPICRYSDTAEDLWKAERIRYDNLIAGGQRILFGFMKKIVLADRLNLLIKDVFSKYDDYDGFVIALCAICYTIQLYMDFSGTMDVVIGSAQIFGVKLPENFKRPFFSTTISEFWKRWHVTLGTFFKDYIFFPLSMSKPLKKLTTKARKKLGNHFGPLLAGAVALFCVWICNGLWHGAGWNYIFFGMFHFVLILLGSIIEPAAIKVTQKLHIKRTSKPYKFFQIIRTTILVCIGELFFRAEGLTAGFKMFKKIFTNFTFATLKDGTLFQFGMDKQDYIIIGVSVILILIISILQERGMHIRESISKRNIAIQFAIYYALILFIIIFGAYGGNYVPVDPIYAGF